MRKIVSLLLFCFFVSVVSVTGEGLRVEYSHVQDEVEGDEYTHPALVIDNQAYLKELEQRRKQRALQGQGTTVIVINTSKSPGKYRDSCDCNRGEYQEFTYFSGGTVFSYVNGYQPAYSKKRYCSENIRCVQKKQR